MLEFVTAIFTSGVVLGLIIEAGLHPLTRVLIRNGWANRFLDDHERR